MKKLSVKFPSSVTDIYFNSGIKHLNTITSRERTILITDENIYKANKKRFGNWDTIVLKPGEEYKVQATADAVIDQLIKMQADRSTTLVGVGGGVITDLTGYVASVFMRGIRFGFIPTSILGLVDASIGGKNGIDVGIYKNMVGIIRQPAFILHDLNFLESLPQKEWENGFAEIIKHACIKDPVLFKELEKKSVKEYQNSLSSVDGLIKKNVLIKLKVVQKDEFEHGERRLLNFGHTIGHALENQYELLHGQAVSIGMTCACQLSERITGFKDRERVVKLLSNYNLPTYASFNKKKVFNVLKLDKKRERKDINLILLDKIGRGVVKKLSLKNFEKLLMEL